MYVYEANVRFDTIDIRRYEIIKETEKQYQLSGGKRLNKSMIGFTDSYGYSYELTEEKSLEVVKNTINKDIEKHKRMISRLEEQLNFPLKKYC
jgi:hypothetical protein